MSYAFQEQFANAIHPVPDAYAPVPAAAIRIPSLRLRIRIENPLAAGKLLKAISATGRTIVSAFSWAGTKLAKSHSRKRLRVCETVPLGDKRFIALVQVDGRQFLLGGGAASVSLLAQLDSSSAFSDALKQACELNGMKA
ncbi:MAG TPA: flagellar biosynthetic protein FliO [Terriglobales bacterium]|jgi:hypothetical protein|nr:flagellar biosynthetic protein FliO [Terriglobales bacterium]